MFNMKISQKHALRIMEEDKELILLDVRTKDEYASGHIKGAINIPNETISNTKHALLPDTGKTILLPERKPQQAGRAEAV